MGDSELDKAGWERRIKLQSALKRAGIGFAELGWEFFFALPRKGRRPVFFGIGRAHQGSGFGYACFTIREYLWEIIDFLCCFPSVDGGSFDWRRQAAAKRFRVVPVSESNVRKRGEIRWAGWLFVR